MLPQIVLGERALRQLSYRTFASVAPTMPPSAESMVTRTPSTPGAGPAESAENFSRREEAKLSFAAPSVAFESCETGWTVYIFTSFPLNGSHLPEKMLVSSRSSHSMRKTSSLKFIYSICQTLYSWPSLQLVLNKPLFSVNSQALIATELDASPSGTNRSTDIHLTSPEWT